MSEFRCSVFAVGGPGAGSGPGQWERHRAVVRPAGLSEVLPARPPPATLSTPLTSPLCCCLWSMFVEELTRSSRAQPGVLSGAGRTLRRHVLRLTTSTSAVPPQTLLVLSVP